MTKSGRSGGKGGGSGKAGGSAMSQSGASRVRVQQIAALTQKPLRAVSRKERSQRQIERKINNRLTSSIDRGTWSYSRSTMSP
jgi:hypothetical protein